MASFSGSHIFLTIVVCFAFLLKTSHCTDTLQPAQGPSKETNYAPRPLSSYEKYLTNCASRIEPKCGEQIFFGVFVGNQTVSDFCCLNLVNDVGKSCHTDMTRYAVRSPLFRKKQTQILNRCQKIWNDCTLVPSPPTNPHYHSFY